MTDRDNRTSGGRDERANLHTTFTSGFAAAATGSVGRRAAFRHSGGELGLSHQDLGVSVDANLSVFGFNAAGAGLDLHGSLLLAVPLGAGWGGGAGGLGALPALATGAAGRRASPYAVGHAAGRPAEAIARR